MLNTPQLSSFLSPIYSLFSTLSGVEEERIRQKGGGEMRGRREKSGSKKSRRVERCTVEIEVKKERKKGERRGGENLSLRRKIPSREREREKEK